MTATTTDPTATSGGPLNAGPHRDGLLTGTPPERFTSRNPADFAVPTGREEEWRFTPLRALRPLFQPYVGVAQPVSVESVVPAGAQLSSVPRSHPLIGSVLRPADRVSALAMAFDGPAQLLTIDADAQLDEPVVITVTGQGGLNAGHLFIDIGRFAKATVVLDHLGSAQLAANVEVRVGDGASATVITVQDWDADAIHVAAHTASVGRDASFRHINVTLGGKLVRIAPTIDFAGPGGHAELLGLSFAGAGQHQEARLYVDHSQPDCSSDVLYKNALTGVDARTVWIGDVRIRPSATGTETFELNRNLVLSDGARADSVPNLEIQTGEIAGAGHASATGRFDDLQLFYLQSRGIPAEDARRLVVRGFFADIISRIGVPALQDRLMHTIEQRLGAVEEIL
jgi:Fe-S cluster assembly protein SufD